MRNAFLISLYFLSPTFSQTALAQLSALAYRIVVIGSSTAAGYGASPRDSAWVNRYRSFLQKTNPENSVINLAVGGYQTYHLMPSGTRPPDNRPPPDTLRNITKALALQADAIIINLPSNDAAAGYSAAEQLANFDTIVQTAQRAGVPIWICTTQPRNFSADKVQVQRVVLDSMFRRQGFFAIDFWDDLATADGWLKPELNAGDGIHLNNAGHGLLYARVVEKNIPEMLYFRVPIFAKKNWEQAVFIRFRHADRTRIFDARLVKICTPLLSFDGTFERPGIYWMTLPEAFFLQMLYFKPSSFQHRESAVRRLGVVRPHGPWSDDSKSSDQ